MTQIEYIPGDLVMTNGVPVGTAKGVVYRVTSSDPNKTLTLNNGTVIKGSVSLENVESTNLGDDGFLFCESGAWVKDVVPIPLTPEILEKNGWEWDDQDFRLGALDLFPVGNYFVLDGFCNKKLKYVHQLQHLLFGLYDNSELKI